jgi:hypothetical protein
MYEAIPSLTKCKRALRQICNLKKRKNLTNDELIKVEKYRYYWDIYNSNYTRALPYELQNIILSFIDPNTRMKILKALYYKKIKSKVNNITTNATASELYGIYKHIATFRSYGILPEISAFEGVFRHYIDARNFNSFRHHYNDVPHYVVGHIKTMLQYQLKYYTNIHKIIENKDIIYTLEIGMKSLYLRILRLI